MSCDMPSGRTDGGTSTTEDRILYWPVATAVTCALAVVVAWANLFFGSLLLVPIVLLFWAGMGVRAAIMCAAWWRARAWRRFCSAVILPVTALAMVVCFAPLWSVGRMTGNYVHLIVLYPRYKAEISELTGDAPRFLIWEWTGSEFCGSGVAYDDRDELEPSMPPKVWGGRYGVSVAGESRAFGHFYFVDICPQQDRQ
jgi:hypothetical protein